jgi:hypothetical protein
MRHPLCALLLLAPLAVAQVPSQPPPPEANPPKAVAAGPEVKDGKLTIPLELSPATAPKPLSDFHLEAGYGDKKPGDKLSGFLKCFMEQDRFYGREHQEKIEGWRNTPLAELPADVRDLASVNAGMAYAPKYAGMMVFADQAARYSRTEWNEYFNLRNDGVNFLLPEVQKLRAVAGAVHLRMRAEVKAGEFDKAVVSARTLFGLTRMLETHPTLIAQLVGIAVATFAVNAVEEMVARPGCPNLYWSFADLPTPFVSLREGLGGERVFTAATFGKAIPTDRALSDAEVTRAVQRVEEVIAVGADKPNPLDKAGLKFAALTANDNLLDDVRARLTKAGTTADVVKAMPKIQLAMLADLRRYDEVRDEVFKWMNRPHPEAVAGLADAEVMIRQEKQAGWVIAPFFLPHTQKVKVAQAKLDQRLAYLMTVEAIRLHAATNDGKLPEKLAEVKVTVPADPVSGKPFSYSVTDGTATLTGANPSGSEADNRVYELKLRK